MIRITHVESGEVVEINDNGGSSNPELLQVDGDRLVFVSSLGFPVPWTDLEEGSPGERQQWLYWFGFELPLSEWTALESTWTPTPDNDGMIGDSLQPIP